MKEFWTEVGMNVGHLRILSDFMEYFGGCASRCMVAQIKLAFICINKNLYKFISLVEFKILVYIH